MESIRESKPTALLVVGAIFSLVIVSLVAPAPAGADAAGQQNLQSHSFRLPVFSIGDGSTNFLAQVSPSFHGNAHLGELGSVHHSSASFQLLPGLSAQTYWLLSGGAGNGNPIAPPILTYLTPPRPNPTPHTVHLAYSIKDGEVGNLRVFDLSGRSVRTLVEKSYGPVGRVAQWDLRNDDGQPVASGIYFARLKTNSSRITRKIVLLK